MRGFTEAIAMLRYSLRCKAARRGILAMLAMLMLCLVIALAWWGPAQHSQKQLSRDIDARRAAIVDAVRMNEVARAQRKALATVALFEKKLDVSAGQADLIRGIARLATKHGVHVVSQSFDEGREQRSDEPLYMELGLTGDYASIRLLLGDLVTLPMWIEVVEARLERADKGGSQVRAQLRLLTYRGARGRR